jgi:hypothetical protein
MMGRFNIDLSFSKLLNIILVVLLVVALRFLYDAKKEMEGLNPINNQQEIFRLQQENDALVTQLAKSEIKSEIFEDKIDSLQGLKPKIEVKYVTKYKEIMLSNGNQLANEFDSIFTKVGVK